MGIEYLSSFNGGELSEFITPRIDMETYRTGCRTLYNGYVLPYGGVERRVGTKYLTDAIGEDVRLIPFDFAEDDSYVLEFGNNELSGSIIRVHDGDGFTGIELSGAYIDEELSSIKYRRVADVMYLVCPTKPPHKLSRTSVDPLTFTFEEVDFIYPPFSNENEDFNSLVEIQPIPWVIGFDYEVGDEVQNEGSYWGCITAHTSTPFASDAAYWIPIYQDQLDVSTGTEVYLEATDDIFKPEQVGSDFRLRHQRTESSTADAGTLYLIGDTSKEISVDNKGYRVSVYNDAFRGSEGKCKLQGNTGAGWYDIIEFRNGGNYSYNGTGASNERIRIYKINDGTGKFYYSNYEIGADSNRRVSSTFVNTDGTTPELDVSFSNWEVNTGGIWNGVVELEKSVDGGETWGTEVIIVDTYGSKDRNVVFPSPAKERANTLIRVKYTNDSGTIDININNQSIVSEGIVELTEYIDANTYKGIIVNSLGSAAPTKRWAFSAFNGEFGYPAAIDLFEERILYAGTSSDPATVWMSVVGDFENFQTGSNDDEALIIEPKSPEPTQWLLSRNDIFQGSRGGLNNIFAIDSNEAISPSNFKNSEVTSFGTSNVQGIFANDVAVYMQRGDKKLRSIVFSDEEQTFKTQDLTILASHITDGGIKELTAQKTPDQIIWTLRDDGIVAGMTYERDNDIFGWHRHDFNGDVKSIAVRPSSGEDEFWIAITRENGTFIEKTESRTYSDDLLDAWYVDSGVKTVLGSSTDVTVNVERNYPDLYVLDGSDADYVNGDYVYDGMRNGRPSYRNEYYGEIYWTGTQWQYYIDYNPVELEMSSFVNSYYPPTRGWYTTYPYIIPTFSGKFTVNINATDHGLVDDDKIRLNGLDVDCPILDEGIYTVALAEPDSFKLKSEDGLVWVSVDPDDITDTIIVSGAGEPTVNGTYTINGMYNDRYRYTIDGGGVDIQFSDDYEFAWAIYDGTEQYTAGTTGIYPPSYGWIAYYGATPDSIVYYYTEAINCSAVVTPVENTWDDLDHLEGEFVQIQGDGGYAGTAIVSGGEVETDDYYTQTVIGKPYVTVVQPMFMEPVGGNYNPMGRNKIINKTVLKFYRTIGALCGTINPKDSTTAVKLDVDVFKVDIPESDKDSRLYKTEEIIFRKTTDNLGEPIIPYTGDKLIYLEDEYSRLQSLYVVQDLPMPMTLLSMATSIKTGKEQ